ADFYHTESQSSNFSTTMGNAGSLKNSSSTSQNSVIDKQAESGNLLFRHKFAKERRTLSLSGNWQLIGDTHDDYLISQNNAYYQGQPSGSQSLDQHKSLQSQTGNLNAQVAYTEPLSKKYSLELAYQLAYDYGQNNQTTFSYSAATSKYDFFVDSLSNNFKQNILQQVPSARINYAGKKLKLDLGMGAGFTHFDLKNLTLSKDYVRHYMDFYPSANLTYTYKPSRSIRFRYNGNTTQPSIDQLQPITNNNNYFNQIIGNPNLKPSFSNSFSVSNNSYNFIKDLFTYIGVNGNFTSNAITMNRVINLDSGKTVSQPVNVNGNHNLSIFTGVGLRVKKINTRFNLSPNFNFSKYAEIINNQESYSRNTSLGMYSGAYLSVPKKYEFDIGDNFSYNLNKISQQNTRIHYFTNEWDLNATVYFHKVWSLSSDAELLSRQKTFPGDQNLKNNIWNARFQRPLHHDDFTIYLSVHDILNQNIGIDRNFTGNTYTQTTNDRLKRYFMIGFEWDLKNKTAKPKSK
ncbi:MAG: TonB-dependent receptor, partial [Bacteroidota bacterium]|nr:TonB-dependent receptor [Bacteroidota bacterium]